MTPTPGDDTPSDEQQPGYRPEPGYWEQQAQQPYGYAPQGPPPGYPAYQPYAYTPPAHPESSKALTLGLVAVVGGVTCYLPIVVAPIAWVIGNRVTREIDASGGRLGGRSEAQAGKILGIVGTCLLVLGLVLVIAYIVLMVTILDPAFDDSGPSNV